MGRRWPPLAGGAWAFCEGSPCERPAMRGFQVVDGPQEACGGRISGVRTSSVFGRAIVVVVWCSWLWCDWRGRRVGLEAWSSPSSDTAACAVDA